MSNTPKTSTVTQEEVSAVIDGVTVNIAGDETPLGSLMKDIEQAHKDLDDYKNGAMLASQALDEKIAEAALNDNDQLQQILKDVKDTTFGVYLRVQYGDEELLGERNPDAEYHGYFGSD